MAPNDRPQLRGEMLAGGFDIRFAESIGASAAKVPCLSLLSRRKQASG
jgi:hypothetical protein